MMGCFKMVGVYFAVFIFTLNFVSCIKKECPTGICLCLASYVECQSHKLEHVPKHLPKWTTHLNLYNNAINQLDDIVWRNLTDLQELKLNRNHLESISKNAFKYQRKLLILELNRNQLTRIDALTFKPLQHLTTLKLKKNQISQLMDGAFYGLGAINKLILDFNHVQTIAKGWLYGLDTLKDLLLSHNDISSIESGAWEFCKVLTNLDLSYNNLDSIQTNAFKYLENLEKLNLNNNKITFIEENAFELLTELKILYLNSNKISWAVDDANGVFQSLVKLTKFHLADNDIKSINQNAFVGLTSLIQLNLMQNNICTIQESAFESMPSLKDLAMNTSALLCDSNIRSFAIWLETNKFPTVHTVCAYPADLKNKDLQKVNISELIIAGELPKPRLIRDLDAEIMALKGENVSLHCVARSSHDASMTFHWKKDNVEIMPTGVYNHTVASKNTKLLDVDSELNLTRVRDADAGKYQCVVSNIFGTTYSQKASISVLIFPTFIKTPSNVTVHAGETASLACSAYGKPQPEITWHKDGGTNDFPAATERRMRVMPTDDIFFIIDVKPADMGVYSCSAHNIAGTVVANATLVVQQKPSFVHAIENKEVTAGELAVLQCMAAGLPKPTIRWLKEGESIAATERHFFTAEDQLMIIIDTVQSDTGDYQCRLNNSLGEVTATGHLTVKPGALNTRDMLGILIIAVVCCAVITSLVWVIIIYQTRLRMPRVPSPETRFSFTDPRQFPDDDAAGSDRSSCKDSGTGDSTKRSNDDLVGVATAQQDDSDQVKPSICDTTHTPLLHYPQSTNHDRSETVFLTFPEPVTPCQDSE